MGIHLIAQHQRLARLAIYLPSAFVQLPDNQFGSALLRGQVLQLFGKFTHQIAAGNPDWQRDALLFMWFGNRQGNVE